MPCTAKHYSTACNLCRNFHPHLTNAAAASPCPTSSSTRMSAMYYDTGILQHMFNSFLCPRCNRIVKPWQCNQLPSRQRHQPLLKQHYLGHGVNWQLQTTNCFSVDINKPGITCTAPVFPQANSLSAFIESPTLLTLCHSVWNVALSAHD